MFLDNHVELGASDDFDLQRLWQGSGRINTAAANQDEKLADRLERLSRKLVTEAFASLCMQVLAMEPEAVEKHGAQERLTRIMSGGLPLKSPKEMRADAARFVQASYELYDAKGLALLPTQLQNALPHEIWVHMPGKSVIDKEVHDVMNPPAAVAGGAAPAGGNAAQARVARLAQAISSWVADAANKVPVKSKQAAAPVVPSAPPGAKAVVLRCDAGEQLYPTHSGCGTCGSMFHKKADHRRELGGGGGGGGGNNNNAGAGRRGQGHAELPCLNCGKHGHKTHLCSEAVCNNCGKKGHWAGKCTSTGKTKEPTAPATSTQGEKPEGNKPDGSKYSVVSQQSVACVCKGVC